MNDCPNGDIRDLLPDLLHDRLDPPTRAMVEQHVASCEDCRAELALLRELRTTLRRAPAVDASAIAAAIPSYRPAVRQRSWGGWRAAAAIAAIAVGGTSIALVSREQGRPGATDVVAVTLPARTSPSATAVPVPDANGTSTQPATPAPDAPPRAPASAPVAVAERVSLAMTGGAISELSDHELSTLVNEIESLDALPSEDVDGGALDGSLSLEQSR